MNRSNTVGARERILQAAYDLFSRRGIRDVTVDEIIAQSKVAIATFYRHFSSKDQLAVEFLGRRQQMWTSEFIVRSATERSDDPCDQLLAVFDILGEWFARDDFEGDAFVKVLLEMGPDHPLGRASISHLSMVRATLRGMAERAGLRDPQEFSHAMHILMKGCIITASMGDADAAERARTMAVRLIRDHTEPGETHADCVPDAASDTAG